MDAQAALQSLERHGTYIKDAILDRPILSGSLAGLASAYLLAKLYHASLRRKVKHIPSVGDSARQAGVDVKEVESLPPALLASPRDYRIVHDKSVVVIPGPDVGLLLARADVDELSDVFTRLLRSNMLSFSGSVQGWLTWWSMPKAQRSSFTKGYIATLGFGVGDRVSGIWEVVRRDPLKVEFALRPPPGLGSVQGVLVVSLRTRGTGGVLAIENVQYIRKDEGKRAPLEGGLARWLHEVLAWRLLLTGAGVVSDAAATR